MSCPSLSNQSDNPQCDSCPDTILIILPLFIKYRQDMQSLKPIYFVISHNVLQDFLI